MTDVRELEGPSVSRGPLRWQWQKRKVRVLAYPAHICKCKREIRILDRSGSHIEEVGPMFCGRRAIGRLPDTEGGDADNNGDEVFFAVISYDGHLWIQGRGNMEGRMEAGLI